MKCDEARNWIPRYQDGELDEEFASPLRRHLMECTACREVAKSEVNLKRWFRPTAEPVVPAGFAARVARRAFAGDPGYSGLDEVAQREVELQPAVRASATYAAPKEPALAPILPFVLRMTAVAAALLMVLAVGLRVRSLPGSGQLDAESLSDVIQVIEALDAAEQAAESSGKAGESLPAPSGTPGATGAVAGE